MKRAFELKPALTKALTKAEAKFSLTESISFFALTSVYPIMLIYLFFIAIIIIIIIIIGIIIS